MCPHNPHSVHRNFEIFPRPLFHKSSDDSNLTPFSSQLQCLLQLLLLKPSTIRYGMPISLISKMMGHVSFTLMHISSMKSQPHKPSKVCETQTERSVVPIVLLQQSIIISPPFPDEVSNPSKRSLMNLIPALKLQLLNKMSSISDLLIME